LEVFAAPLVLDAVFSVDMVGVVVVQMVDEDEVYLLLSSWRSFSAPGSIGAIMA
jgi:hypothetical protein